MNNFQFAISDEISESYISYLNGYIRDNKHNKSYCNKCEKLKHNFLSGNPDINFFNWLYNKPLRVIGRTLDFKLR